MVEQTRWPKWTNSAPMSMILCSYFKSSLQELGKKAIKSNPKFLNLWNECISRTFQSSSDCVHEKWKECKYHSLQKHSCSCKFAFHYMAGLFLPLITVTYWIMLCIKYLCFISHAWIQCKCNVCQLVKGS